MSTDVASVVNAASTAFAAIAAAAGVFVAYKVHQNQKLLSQRQLLLPLWEYMSALSDIEPKAPITPDVIKVVNTLELVALCCEGGLVDAQVIRRTFREEFIKHYLAVKQCVALPGMHTTGEQLLTQNRAAAAFFDTLYKEHLSYGQIRPL